MTELLLAFLFFSLMLAFYGIGVPIGYSMGITVLLIMLLPFGGTLTLSTIVNRMFSGVDSFILLAIPFFIMAGRLLNESGMTEDLFGLANELFGGIRGGLGHVNVIVSMVFSGMSGAAVADAAGLGTIEYKAMTDHGYKKSFAAGITAASATIGPIIPPSIAMIIYAMLAQESVGALFIAGVVPGVGMGLAMMSTIFLKSNRDAGEQNGAIDVNRVLHLSRQTLPALLTPIIIVGGIAIGLFTATEAAIVASIYTAFLGFFYYRSLDLTSFYEVCKSTFVDSVTLLLILAFANLYAYWLNIAGIPILLTDVILGISNNPVIILLAASLLVLFMGMFLDTIAILLILVPVLIPVLPQFGIHPVQFGIVILLALMIGMITPPFGLIIFAIENVTDISAPEIIKGVKLFYVPLAAVLLITILVPDVSLFLPRALGFI